MSSEAFITGTSASANKQAKASSFASFSLNLAIIVLLCILILIWRLPVFNKVLYAPVWTYNFGSVEKGTIVTSTFTVRNLHPWPVTVIAAVGGCGCTKAFPGKEVPFTLSPLSSVEVRAQLDTATKSGPESQTIAVITDDNSVGTPLIMSGTVTPASKEN